MATGVFDLLHPGHLHYLTESRKLGDELVVVIARDSTVKKLKREPVVNEESRRQMVESLKPVDRAVLGSTTDMYDTVEKVRPDVIALGYDQRWNDAEVQRKCAERGVQVRVVRLSGVPERLLSSNHIIERVIQMHDAGKV
jgi:FAD synthetase